MGVDELATAVARGETAVLTKIPGVGKKTAERLVLELKGKLVTVGPVETPVARPGPAPVSGRAEVLVATLTRMGFKPSEAERAAVATLQARGDAAEEAPLGDLVRDALAALSR
jgi:Holliday junction DNA helicase RuvA